MIELHLSLLEGHSIIAAYESLVNQSSLTSVEQLNLEKVTAKVITAVYIANHNSRQAPLH